MGRRWISAMVVVAATCTACSGSDSNEKQARRGRPVVGSTTSTTVPLTAPPVPPPAFPTTPPTTLPPSDSPEAQASVCRLVSEVATRPYNTGEDERQTVTTLGEAMQTAQLLSAEEWSRIQLLALLTPEETLRTLHQRCQDRAL
jgi:hypothetical protein